MTDPHEITHMECDCVPDLGPSHCHLCSGSGQPVEWPCPPTKQLHAQITQVLAENSGVKGWPVNVADALMPLVSAVITEAKAEALEEAAAARFTDEIQGAYTSAPTWLRARAAEYRTPKETP